ncbi:MAG: hypothetical protein E7269_01950 [Lachnospiraceae bacterium]|nr:hypothetical protein [Lachnospiraceae bacterium]
MQQVQDKFLLRYIFLILLLLGAVASVLCQKYFGESLSAYYESLDDFQSQMGQANTEFAELFPYVILHRGKELLILCCFNLTNLSKWYQGWYGLKLGFLITTMCGGYLALYGLPGLLYGIAFYFPHGILLFYLIYLSIRYVEHYKRCKASMKEWRKLIIGMLGLFLLLCFLESTVNPWLLKRVMRLL